RETKIAGSYTARLVLRDERVDLSVDDEVAARPRRGRKGECPGGTIASHLYLPQARTRSRDPAELPDLLGIESPKQHRLAPPLGGYRRGRARAPPTQRNARGEARVGALAARRLNRAGIFVRICGRGDTRRDDRFDLSCDRLDNPERLGRPLTQ